MSENVKDKVKQVLGLMGICPDYPVRLYCSFIAPRSTAKEPVNRDFLEIPDEWVAKVADRIAELEAEIAQLKAQDGWHDGIPSESGWYRVQVNGKSPEVGMLAGETNCLKECPFCGGPARKECRGVGKIGVRQSSEFVSAFQQAVFFVECGDCHCYTREFYSEDSAIEAWNRRDHPASE